MVSMGGVIYGKPADEAEAYRTLSSLSGQTHSVYTGVKLIYTSASGQVNTHKFFDVTEVS